MNNHAEVFIYGLIDPQEGKIRYVGATRDINRRNGEPAGKWLYSKGNDAKNKWIRSMVERGQLPELVQLEVTNLDKWTTRRRDWIAQFRKAGYPLLNADKGPRCRVAAIRLWALPAFKERVQKGWDTYRERQINNILESLKPLPEWHPSTATA